MQLNNIQINRLEIQVINYCLFFYFVFVIAILFLFCFVLFLTKDED